MWLTFALGGTFLLAIINYLDEFLTQNNSVSLNSSIHKKIGGLILISTLLNIIGVCVIKLIVGDVSLGTTPLIFSLLSAIPTVFVWTIYFYLLNKYHVYQIIPLFQLTSIWLLLIQVFTGGTVSTLGIAGVLILLVGIYLFDIGKLKWVIPSKLLFVMIGVSLVWSVDFYLVRRASELSSGTAAVTFWQYVGITIIGLILITVVREYRAGFFDRIKRQGKLFLGLSFVNESISQVAYVLGNFAIAFAPMAAYASSINGVQSIFLLGLFLVFNKKKTSVNSLQVIAIILVAVGVFMLEISQ